MIRFKYLARLQKGRIPLGLFKEPGPNRAPYLSMEYLRNQTEIPEFAETDGAVVAQHDDIILLWDGSNAGEFFRAKHGVVSSTAALVKVAHLLPGYFFYLCKSLEGKIRTETVGMGIPHVNGDFVNNLQVTFPPENIQREIAAFLDQRTGELDKLVSEKERLLVLLAEKRRTLIAQAVTRGINPAVPLRHSRIEWLGSIPAHWRLLPLRRVIQTLDQGWSPVASNLPAEVDEHGVLKLSAIKHGVFLPGENKALPVSDDVPSGLTIKADDVFLTRANTPSLVGDAAVAEVDYPNLIFSDLIYRLRVNPELIDPRWLALALISDIGRRQIEAEAKGSSGSMVKLAQDQVLGLLIPVPPIEEQRVIMRSIDEATHPIRQLAASTKATVDLLVERRASLIAAAVLGEGLNA